MNNLSKDIQQKSQECEVLKEQIAHELAEFVVNEIKEIMDVEMELHASNFKNYNDKEMDEFAKQFKDMLEEQKNDILYHVINNNPIRSVRDDNHISDGLHEVALGRPKVVFGTFKRFLMNKNLRHGFVDKFNKFELGFPLKITNRISELRQNIHGLNTLVKQNNEIKEKDNTEKVLDKWKRVKQ